MSYAASASLLCLASLPAMAQAQASGSLSGRVTADGAPVPFAFVAVRGMPVRTVADSAGAYRLSWLQPGRYAVTAAAIGHSTREHRVTLGAGESLRLDFVLEPAAVEVDPISVTGTMRQTTVSQSPVKVEVVPEAVLQRNASKNLTLQMQYVNGLYNQVDCGVCYTNNIRINGMEGPYTSVLIDGAPIMSALSSVYGLNGINPSIVERIEIVKGPSSTLYGSEALAGVINVITKDPRFTPRFVVDVSGTTHGEANLDFAVTPRLGRAAGLISGSLAYNDRFIDDNGDGFADLAMNRRASLFGKLELDRGGRPALELAAKYYLEDRAAGEAAWSRAQRGSGELYGESIHTHRIELLGSYVRARAGGGVRVDFAYNWHDQDSFYGDTEYDATQQVAFANVVLDRVVAGRHDLLVGASARYQVYDDNTPATPGPERRFIPGVFVQNELMAAPELALLGGMRLDHHRDHGPIVAPRAAVKWQPLENTVLRLNAGTGFRVVNLFTEDHAALTGTREVVIGGELRPERSSSVALNANQVVEFGPHPMMIDVDAYYTHFSNKIIPDYDADPNQIVYENLDGHAVSRGIALSLNQNVGFDRFLYTVGFTLQDVYAVRDGILEPETFAPDYRAVFSATYNVPGLPLRLDYTGSLTGPMRLPEYDPPFRRPTRSPTYAVHNLLGTWKLDAGKELYAAVNNVLDYAQPSALVDPGNPFGDHFDTAYVYGPLVGRQLVAGLRFGASR